MYALRALLGHPLFQTTELLKRRGGSRLRGGVPPRPQNEAARVSHSGGGTPMRLKKTLSVASTVCLIALGYVAITYGQQNSSTAVYNPYPPGILPANLDSEIARVLREVDVVEGRAIQRWHSLPPPTRLPVQAGPNPPVLKGTGTESIETLGELLLFDKYMSAGRNQ